MPGSFFDHEVTSDHSNVAPLVAALVLQSACSWAQAVRPAAANEFSSFHHFVRVLR
jgi:hypothetical protein